MFVFRAGHGLLAYGSNYTVVVVDTLNVQVVQCLDRHKSMVKKVGLIFPFDVFNSLFFFFLRFCGGEII